VENIISKGGKSHISTEGKDKRREGVMRGISEASAAKGRT
jgi:hypothetical protein